MAEKFTEGFKEVVANFSQDDTKVITESVKMFSEVVPKATTAVGNSLAKMADTHAKTPEAEVKSIITAGTRQRDTISQEAEKVSKKNCDSTTPTFEKKFLIERRVALENAHRQSLDITNNALKGAQTCRDDKYNRNSEDSVNSDADVE